MTVNIADLRAKLDEARTWLAEHPHFHSARKSDVKALTAGMEALLDELERLATWKAEALTVSSEWEKTWESAGRPGKLGSSKAVGVRDEIERLRRQRDDLTASLDERWANSDHLAAKYYNRMRAAEKELARLRAATDEEVPELFPGTRDALESLTIRAREADE